MNHEQVNSEKVHMEINIPEFLRKINLELEIFETSARRSIVKEISQSSGTKEFDNIKNKFIFNLGIAFKKFISFYGSNIDIADIQLCPELTFEEIDLIVAFVVLIPLYRQFESPYDDLFLEIALINRVNCLCDEIIALSLIQNKIILNSDEYITKDRL